MVRRHLESQLLLWTGHGEGGGARMPDSTCTNDPDDFQDTRLSPRPLPAIQASASKPGATTGTKAAPRSSPWPTAATWILR